MKPEAADYIGKARQCLDDARQIATVTALHHIVAREAYLAAYHAAEAYLLTAPASLPRHIAACAVSSAGWRAMTPASPASSSPSSPKPTSTNPSPITASARLRAPSRPRTRSRRLPLPGASSNASRSFWRSEQCRAEKAERIPPLCLPSCRQFSVGSALSLPIILWMIKPTDPDEEKRQPATVGGGMRCAFPRYACYACYLTVIIKVLARAIAIIGDSISIVAVSVPTYPGFDL
jgi:hypothetical protein